MKQVQYDPDFLGPLHGVRVLDLSRLVAGNMLSLQLADHGAEVIKVESPGKGDPLRHWRPQGVPVSWKIYGRNKKSLSLNLRSEEGRGLLLRLARTAQLFIENFRPGTLERMGLSPEALLEANPTLVVVRISGFGQTGPYRHRPGFGTLVEAMSGFAYRNGFADREPVLPPLAMADMIAGHSGGFRGDDGFERGRAQAWRRSDRGPVLARAHVLDPRRRGGVAPGEWRGAHPIGQWVYDRVPRNVYQTSDGKWLAMSGSMQSMAERIFKVIGREDLITDPRYRTNEDRVQHREEVDAIVGRWVGARTLDENMAVFERAQVTVAPVYDIAQICADPHFLEREVLVCLPDDELGEIPHHNVFPRLSATPGGFKRPAPSLGQHNGELLGALGLSAEEIDALGRRRVL